MGRILPFKGLKYNKNIVGNLGAVFAPPYDSISKEQQELLYNNHPFNVIRLEYGLVNDTDNDLDNRYTRSAQTLAEWMHSGILVPDRQPSLYVYSQDFTAPDGRQLSCRGIICLVKLEEYETGRVVPHEETLSKAKADRLKLITECDANFSPVYALYTDEDKKISRFISDSTTETAEIVTKTPDGFMQNLWTISDENIIKEICSALEDKTLFIADGHHRYETAVSYRNNMRERNPDHTGREPYNYIMMFLTDMESPGLVALPTHRMVKNVVGYNEQAIVSELEQYFFAQKVIAEDIEQSMELNLAHNIDIPSFAMYTGKEYYYLLKLKDFSHADDVNPDKPEALRHLDVMVLHSLIFGKVFAMSDAELKNQTYLSYTRNISEAVDEVKKGSCQCSFMLNPTKISQIKEITAAKEKLPQKSTYIYPKLKTGLVINKFN